jgi:HlyD family secretion protein
MDRQIKKKFWTLKRILIISASGLFLVFAVYVFLFKFRVPTLNVEKDRITISTVTRGPFQEFIPIMGNVLPKTTYYLTADEGGRVEAIFKEAGTMVRKGERLLKLNNPQLVLDIMWRESDFFQASNNLRQTRLSMEQYKMQLRQQLNEVENQVQQQKRVYERQTEMFKWDLVSKHDFELSKDQYEFLVRKKEITVETQANDLSFRDAQVKALEDTVKRLEESLALAKQREDNLYIKAPISGYLTALQAEIGESKQQGIRLGQIDVLESNRVRARIDEYHLPRTKEGLSGEFKLGADTYKLLVRKVFPQVQDGAFEVDLDFVGAEPRDITRGQTLHIQLYLSGLAEAVLLDRGGFYETTGGNWVFVVDASGGFAVKRPVKIGRQNPEKYEILEGLQIGEKVVTSSYENYGKIERLVFK